MIYKVDIKRNTEIVDKLYEMFSDMTDTLILSCLQGHMGDVWVDNTKNPTVAELLVGDFVFFAGDCESDIAKELLKNLPKSSLVVVHTEQWKELVEQVHKENCNKFSRYSFFKDITKLDYEYVKSFISTLSDEYELRKVDEEILEMKSFYDLSEDFISQFESKEDFLKRGCGYCILHDGQVICGATSYSIYDNGIEIEIDTHVDYRRRGLATVVASAIIIDCLDRGIYPSWDAANLTSVALAKKLGYVMDRPYDTYYVNLAK